MTDQQGEATLRQFVETGVDAILALHIERGGRLIEDQDLAVAQVCAGKRQFLPFAAGEFALAQFAPQQRLQAMREAFKQGIAPAFTSASR